ncbi:MAG: Mur ligase domain-containing protein [Ferruginibacter sp.]
MISSVGDFKSIFFIGVAGTGMSAIAQYLSGVGKIVKGSDRYFNTDQYNETRTKLEEAGIKCFIQNGEGITEDTDLVIISAAIEDTVAEVQKAKSLSIPIIKRSELLSMIARSKKTIAIGGTSGKSTTSAMLFEIMETAGHQPGIISGAGLVSLIRKGKIGNTKVGQGEWLIIEADESDGSIVEYTPEVGLLLNVDKDHQELEELVNLFTIFKHNTTGLFIVNQSNVFAKVLSQDIRQDFSTQHSCPAGFVGVGFQQRAFNITFRISIYGKHQHQLFSVSTIGRHNMENAIAAIAIAYQLGISLELCQEGLVNYQGIYRRHQMLGIKNGVCVIDDYAHNPVKCAASILACQGIASKVVAWFQPHGYGPTRFLKNDFINEISAVLRPQDEIWMSEIFYAGGTTEKNISSNDLISEISASGKNAFFIEDRKDFLENVRSHLTTDTVLLLMGARDPGLEEFSSSIWKNL